MSVHLVRNVETKRLLGLYWSPTTDELWWEVDGAVDPSNYEYCKISHGALFFYNEEPEVEQAPDEEDLADDFDPPRIPWDTATPSELLWSALHRAADQKWKRFPFADQPGGGVHQVFKEVAARKSRAERQNG